MLVLTSGFAVFKRSNSASEAAANRDVARLSAASVQRGFSFFWTRSTRVWMAFSSPKFRIAKIAERSRFRSLLWMNSKSTGSLSGGSRPPPPMSAAARMMGSGCLRSSTMSSAANARYAVRNAAMTASPVVL